MSRAPGHGPGYPCLGHGLILVWYQAVEKTLDMRAPGHGPGYGTWGSWSGTKQLKPLDMSRAPGHGPGYPCLGHGFLGLGPSS
jgi:hypothetical protein